METSQAPPGEQVLVVRRLADRQRADELMLALRSLGVSVWLRYDPADAEGPWSIEAKDARSAVAAVRELAEVERELDSPPASAEPSLPNSRLGIIWPLSIVVANVAVFLLLERAGGSTDHETLLRFGAIRSELISHGELWRLATATFLHIGARHLIGNMALLSILGPLAQRLWGAGRMFAVYLGGGIIGNLAGFVLGSAHALKAGASGAILALLGGFGGQRLRMLLASDAPRYRPWHVLAMIVAFYGLVVGVRPESDHYAHVGGIVGGLLLALLLAPRELSRQANLRLQTLLLVACLAVAFSAAAAAYLYGGRR